VGAALARRTLELTSPGDSLLLLAGRGHNGDDVRAMVPHLGGRAVRLIEVIEPEVAQAEITRALKDRPSLVVDGLFGIGLSRPLNGAWVELISALNQSGARILAVDVPSGLDADTGEPHPVAVSAAITLTIGAPKCGLLAERAASHVGRLEVVQDVGLIPCPAQSECQWTTADDFSHFPPPRPVAGHKGTFGHVAIIAGSLGYHGAAVLAARGAQRARPGLITLFTQPDVYGPVAAQLQAVMVRSWPEAARSRTAEKFTAFLFGPGLAAETLPPSVREWFRHLWSNDPRPVIADASALDWLPPGATPLGAIRAITPHPGEAARLLGVSTQDIQCDRPASLRALSEKFGGCRVVLKGRHTLVGANEGDLFVNSSGNDGLAQGGSGDVLAGFITGWLAQPHLASDPTTLLRHAVFEHGAAAERLSARRENWIIEELPDELGRG
jgi:NAD(P)H-hydrate epimerase